ncbi:D-glycerate dehydrogenase [Altererythrobacter indicus]|uniref:D-glycerate dehydrogenase n=1 Tax=Altericroceibacterium indicum TaxID=374177 RepID=A0A845ABI0_9SPHN|nr:D-glycerate dehydrogenase [Altericroceibacterium indicum]MXP24538.1 D-glycerate dehydrogenase [Altericroceibacterium indicum]
MESDLVKPRILVTRRWPEAVEQELAKVYDVTFNASDTPLDQQTLAAAMGEYDVLAPTVSDRIDADVIKAGDRVKLIANYGVGFDHIALDAAHERGIAVTNTPGVLTDSTADLTMALLLMAVRRGGEGERELRSGQWTGWRPTHMLGTSLHGKVLGLVGFGRIGQATACRARAFGMKIAYYGRHPVSHKTACDLDAHYYSDFHKLLRAAHVVSLHVPGGAETRHMIDAAAIQSMRKGAYLVNTARGEVVDHDALAEALRNGHLSGAGLDVYPEEPQIPEALLGLENVVLLPHLGSATHEAREAMGRKVIANIHAWTKGQHLPDQVA